MAGKKGQKGNGGDNTSRHISYMAALQQLAWLYAVHAAALALAGRIGDSKSVAKSALELEPKLRVGPWEHIAPKFMLPELWRPLLAGMRQAGLPE